jgi:hypothetical protein
MKGLFHNLELHIHRNIEELKSDRGYHKEEKRMIQSSEGIRPQNTGLSVTVGIEF